jgi:Spy/CpxP family protein refolding chaperone
MKRNLFTIGVVGLITAIVVCGLTVAAVAGFTLGQAQGASTRSHWHCDEVVLERMPMALNLTFVQQEKVHRILDRAHPQILAIREDARQKKRAVIDATMSEIGPLLTPEQQKKFDDLQKAHQQMHSAKEKLRGALKAPPPPF